MFRLLVVMIIACLSSAFSEEIEVFYKHYIVDSCFAGDRTIYPLKQTKYRLDIDIEFNEIWVDESEYIQKPDQEYCGVSMVDYSVQMKMIISPPVLKDEFMSFSLYKPGTDFDWEYIFKNVDDKWYLVEMVDNTFQK